MCIYPLTDSNIANIFFICLYGKLLVYVDRISFCGTSSEDGRDDSFPCEALLKAYNILMTF